MIPLNIKIKLRPVIEKIDLQTEDGRANNGLLEWNNNIIHGAVINIYLVILFSVPKLSAMANVMKSIVQQPIMKSTKKSRIDD